MRVNPQRCMVFAVTLATTVQGLSGARGTLVARRRTYGHTHAPRHTINASARASGSFWLHRHPVGSSLPRRFERSALPSSSSLSARVHHHQDFDFNHRAGLWIGEDSSAGSQETEVSALSHQDTALMSAGCRVGKRDREALAASPFRTFILRNVLLEDGERFIESSRQT